MKFRGGLPTNPHRLKDSCRGTRGSPRQLEQRPILELVPVAATSLLRLVASWPQRSPRESWASRLGPRLESVSVAAVDSPGALGRRRRGSGAFLGTDGAVTANPAAAASATSAELNIPRCQPAESR